MEILIAALLAIAVAVPGCRYETKKHRIVFVLDDSASMSASDGESSARDRAVKEIISILEKYSPFEVSFIVSGENARFAAGGLSDIAEVGKVLNLWSPSKTSHDANPAINLAFQIGGENSSVCFITDQNPLFGDDGSPLIRDGLVWHGFGRPLANRAFTSASRKSQIGSSTETVFAEIANYSDSESPREISLQASQGEKILFKEKIKTSKTGAGISAAKLSVEIPSNREAPLTLAILDDDALSLDNSVLLLSEIRPPVRVAVRIPGAAENEKLLRKYVDRALRALGSEVLVVEEDASLEINLQEAAQIRKSALESSDAWFLSFAPGEKAKAIFYGPYICDKSNPLLEDIYLEGVRWAIVDSAADGAAPSLISYRNVPLLYEPVSTGDSRCFFMNYAILDSNFHKTASWPVFFYKLIKERAKSLPGFHRRNYRLGEKAALKLAEGGFKPRIFWSSSLADKNSLEIPFSTDEKNFVHFAPEYPGVCKVKISSGAKESEMAAFNFLSHDESDLRKLSSSVYGREEFASMEAELWREQSWIFILLAMLLAFCRALLIKKEEGLSWV
jgi:hypothetical protein